MKKGQDRQNVHGRYSKEQRDNNVSENIYIYIYIYAELISCACTLTALQAVGALRPRASDGPWVIGAIRAKRFTRCNSSSCRFRRDDNIVCLERHDVNRRAILCVGYTAHPFLSTHRIRSIHRTRTMRICSPMGRCSYDTSSDKTLRRFAL